MKSFIKSVALVIIFSFITICCYGEIPAYGLAGLGEKLVRQFWQDVRDKNWSAIEKQLAEGFQSVHFDGARNRLEELDLMKEAEISDYVLHDFKATTVGDILIVTYVVSVEETIVGKRLPKRTSMRLTSWLKTQDSWKMIIHANLNTINQ